MCRPVRQQPGGVGDHLGRTAPGIDHRVPGPVAPWFRTQRGAQRRRVGAVRVQRPRARRLVPADPAVERGDLVATGQCRLHDGPSDMMRSTQDQQPHTRQPSPGRGRAGPLFILGVGRRPRSSGRNRWYVRVPNQPEFAACRGPQAVCSSMSEFSPPVSLPPGVASRSSDFLRRYHDV